jgi:hypothetical protein
MTANNKKNIALVIGATILFLALLDGWSYGFFSILRFVVFATSIYVALGAYNEQKENWTWFFGSIAVLFNPLIPVYLTREIWLPIDFIVAIFMFFSIFFLKFKSK